jgi:hypothetical protein
VASKTVKCPVWDLDDMVWDGVLLEGDDPGRPGLVGVLCIGSLTAADPVRVVAEPGPALAIAEDGR